MQQWTLSKRQQYDLTCILNGAFAPLSGFLDESAYNTVCDVMRLPCGALWPMPITLDVSEAFTSLVELNSTICLVDEENTPLATLEVSSIYKPDKAKEAQQVFGTQDVKHPGVAYLLQTAGDWYLGGRVTQLKTAEVYDFKQYRHTPAELKALFKLYGWQRIIAFQTRNPMHRAHFELTLRAAKQVNANLLLHPVVGMTKPGDVEYLTRVRSYEQVLQHYPAENPVMLSLLPLAMRMGGPREALWHALIRKNYGATHFIVGRDHAGPGLSSAGEPFYAPDAAQKCVLQFEDELGLEIVTSKAVVYVKEKAQYVTEDEIKPSDTVLNISGTGLRAALENQTPVPDWFSFPEVMAILRKAYPPKKTQGFTLFFTGLSGAGKSTLAKAVCARFLEAGKRRVSVLDGDVVRKQLCKGLGFSKEDRETNIERIGYVASEITKHGGIAIAAAIAPFEMMRKKFRAQITAEGGFIEIYVSTPLSVCEMRDTKGLYQKAKEGLIPEFTGVNSPYEAPKYPEITIDTDTLDVASAVDLIFAKLEALGYYRQPAVTHMVANRQ